LLRLIVYVPGQLGEAVEIQIDVQRRACHYVLYLIRRVQLDVQIMSLRLLRFLEFLGFSHNQHHDIKIILRRYIYIVYLILYAASAEGF
jgi:hypothetical protein